MPSSTSNILNGGNNNPSYRYVIHSLIGAEVRNYFNEHKKNTQYIPSTEKDICITVRTAKCFIDEERHPDNPSSNRDYCKEQAKKFE